MPPRESRLLPILRYVLEQYDAGPLNFSVIPKMLLVTLFIAGMAEIWTTLAFASLNPEESQELSGSLTSLYWQMIAGGLSLALLYALGIASLLLCRRRRPELFPRAETEAERVQRLRRAREQEQF